MELAQGLHGFEIQLRPTLRRRTVERGKIVPKGKIKVEEEEEPTMVQEEATEENGIILDLEKKEVESKSTLDVVLPSVPQTHSYVI